jgi:hypothetical protein
MSDSPNAQTGISDISRHILYVAIVALNMLTCPNCPGMSYHSTICTRQECHAIVRYMQYVRYVGGAILIADREEVDKMKNSDNVAKSYETRAEAAYLECQIYPTTQNYAKFLEILRLSGNVGLIRTYRQDVLFAHWMVKSNCRNCRICQICR